MKTQFTSLCSILLIGFAFVSCEKADLPAPDNASISRKTTGGGSTSGTTTATVYGGRSTGIDALVWNTQSPTITSTQTYFALTNFLPAAGGSETASSPKATIPNVLSADSVQASITGQNKITTSAASMKNLNLTIGGHTITANSIRSTASVACGAVGTGNSQFNSLVVDGTPVVITGAPNQAIYFPAGGMILINEQSSSKKGSAGTITVTALHVVLPNVADIKLAGARAEIKC